MANKINLKLKINKPLLTKSVPAPNISDQIPKSEPSNISFDIQDLDSSIEINNNEYQTKKLTLSLRIKPNDSDKTTILPNKENIKEKSLAFKNKTSSTKNLVKNPNLPVKNLTLKLKPKTSLSKEPVVLKEDTRYRKIRFGHIIYWMTSKDNYLYDFETFEPVGLIKANYKIKWLN